MPTSSLTDVPYSYHGTAREYSQENCELVWNISVVFVIYPQAQAILLLRTAVVVID